MINNISKIEFMYGGFFNGYETRTISYENDTWKYYYSHSLNHSKNIVANLKIDFVLKIFSEIFTRYNILNWNNDYYNSNILDGVQWYLYIYDKNGVQIKEISGSNDYPKDFEKFRKFFKNSFKEYENFGSHYERLVCDYLSNKDNDILKKISNLDELTKEEINELEYQFTFLMGNSFDFKSLSNGLSLLPYIRLKLGFTDEAINNKFGDFLNCNKLDSQQLEFCQQIIEYTRKHGDFTPILLQKVSPFCNVDVVSMFGTNFIYLKKLITGLHKPVEWKK